MPGWAKSRENRPLPACRDPRARRQERCSRACACHLRLDDHHDGRGADAGTTSGRSHGLGRARDPGGGKRDTFSAGEQDCESGARVRAPRVFDANLFAAQPVRGVDLQKPKHQLLIGTLAAEQGATQPARRLREVVA